jgi:hypothetical protein
MTWKKGKLTWKTWGALRKWRVNKREAETVVSITISHKRQKPHMTKQTRQQKRRVSKRDASAKETRQQKRSMKRDIQKVVSI